MNWDHIPKSDKGRREFLQATVDLLAQHRTIGEAAAVMGIHRKTLTARKDTATAEGIVPKYYQRGAESCVFPKGTRTDRKPYSIHGVKKVLILNDIHVPYHNEDALLIALEDGQKNECDCILINGDFMDCSSLSKHEKVPSERAGFFDVELPMAGQVLSGIKKMFPNAKKILNEGNHEYMFPRYLARNSEELFRRDCLERELKPMIYDFEFVYRETPINIGRLHVRHGDEFRGGGAQNVARTKYLQASGNIIFGHHHRTQQYIHKTVSGKQEGAWAVGCLCDLSPTYILENQWNLGFAIVNLHETGDFVVQNKMIINGEIY